MKYTATAPNGETITRNSKRVYTHAVLANFTTNGVNEDRWGYMGFSGSKALAEKVLESSISKYLGTPNGKFEGTQFVLVELETI